MLARYLRLNGTTRFNGSSSQAPVDLGLRLLGSREMTGSPFQYTAVMALGASRLGVPARVVTGAEPDTRGIVEHDDVTAWVELQFADGTWRTLDPQRYVGVQMVSGGGAGGGGGDGGGDAEAAAAGAWVKAWLADDDNEEFRIPKGTSFEFPEGAEFEITEPRNYTAMIAIALVGVLGVLLLALLLVPLAKVLRRGHRRRTSSWSGIYVNGWQEVLDAARDRGTPVPDAWSRVAQARELGVGLDLARRADAAVFAPLAGEAEDGREFWDACQELRRQLVSQADRRHQWWSRLNPASLLAGWARSRTREESAAGQMSHEDRRAGGQQPAGA